MSASYLYGLIGGLLIGLGSLLAFATTGKIPGISGVFGRLFVPETSDRRWRLIFLAGLILGAGIAFTFSAHAAEFRLAGRSLVVFGVAGFSVGIGTRVGGGCTSGHGVCGVGRGNFDSMVATVTFMLFGMLTVWLVRYFGLVA